MNRISLTLAALLLVGAASTPGQDRPAPTALESDYLISDFKFTAGGALPELRLHYLTLGRPARDESGHVTNAVMILHGTGTFAKLFLRPQFGGVLFAPGGVLDPARYFIIMPDAIGHGKSSKPSDGLRLRFPHYDYDDMVEAQYRLLTDGLKIDHVRVIIGTSMGCMQDFLWGEAHPDFMDGLMAMACLPVPIAGRNLLWRQMMIDAIRADPAWQGGDYDTEPLSGLRTASDLLQITINGALAMQKTLATPEDVLRFKDESLKRDLATLDANDFLYQVDASRRYDPSPALSRIKARVSWINTADDFDDPPELGIAEREAAHLARGRFVLLPIGAQTHGHISYNWAELWQGYLAALLDQTAPSSLPDRPASQ
jgi:homoserine O-acetyltransferase